MVQPEKKTRAILFSWSPPQIWSKIVHFKFNFQEAKNHSCGGGKFSNPTVTGINNTFWDFKFVGLFYRASPKLY